MSVSEAGFDRVIDPAANPELANSLVQNLISPTATPPLMGDPPSNVVRLPGGYIDADSELHQDARIREITGADEEAMARELRNPNFSIAGVVDIILRRTVMGFGTVEATPAILGDLLVGDRSALLLAIRILTFGSDWEVPDFPCRLCGKTFGVTVELEKDIKVKKLPNPRVQDIDVPLRNKHTATVNLMTGAVQLAMIGEGRTLPEESTIAIDRCIRKIDGQLVKPPIAQRMGMADRHKIIDAMAAAQPGPLMEEVVVPCSICGQSAPYSVSLVDLFR